MSELGESVVESLGVDGFIQFSNFSRKRPKSKTIFDSVEGSKLDTYPR